MPQIRFHLNIAVWIVLIVLLLGDARLWADQTAASPSQGKASQDIGVEEVDQILKDRPQLDAIVQKGSPIWQWLTAAFNGDGLGYHIQWKNQPTSSEDPASAESSAFPNKQNISYIKVDAIDKSGPLAGSQSTPEKVLEGLVFELCNVRHGLEKKKTDHLARSGGISREDYIKACFQQEYEAGRECAEFYEKLWVPFCQKEGLSPTPRLWGLPIEATFEKRLARYPRDFWYPWQYYGKRYDEYVAYAVQAKSGDSFNELTPTDFQNLKAQATAGDAQAEEKTGIACYNGNGTTQDYHQAFEWLLKAASQNDILAEKYLIWIYGHGLGTDQNEAKAFEWNLKAATQNDVASELTVGARYEQGAGVTQDLIEAVKWYQKAAAQGDNEAEDRLGFALMEGRGVPKNQEQGFADLLQAAPHNAHARYAIAACYSKGIFVGRDLVEAYKWCLIALERDQQAYTLSQQLKSQLSADQIKKAEQEATAWENKASDPTAPTGSRL